MDIITRKNAFVNRSLGVKKPNKNFQKFIIKQGEKSLTNKKEKYIIVNVCGDMAQLVERLVRNEEASGSNPLISTTKKGRQQPSFFCVDNRENR